MTTWSLHYHRKVRDNPYDSNSFSEPASPSNADSSNFSTPWSWTNATGLQPSRLFYITDRDTGLCFLIDTGAQVSVVYVNFIVSIMRCIRYYCCAFENAKISKIATNTTLCEVQGCNIPSGPLYISQLVRIGWTCSTYEEFVKRTVLVTSRLIKRGFLYVELVRSFKKFYIKYVNLMSKCNVCMKRHVSDGICGLYDGLPSVYNLVTTRRHRL